MIQRPAPNLNRVTPEEWAYIAGFIDGEGCLSIVHSKRWSSIRISASQKDPRPLWWIQERIGGTVTKIRRRNRVTHSFDSHIWVWQSSERQRVYTILKGLWPYLIVKAEQADALLEYKPNKSLGLYLTELKAAGRG